MPQKDSQSGNTISVKTKVTYQKDHCHEWFISFKHFKCNGKNEIPSFLELVGKWKSGIDPFALLPHILHSF